MVEVCTVKDADWRGSAYQETEETVCFETALAWANKAARNSRIGHAGASYRVINTKTGQAVVLA